MIDMTQLETLIRLLDASPLHRLELDGPDLRLRLVKGADGRATPEAIAAAETVTEPATGGGLTVTAPTAGVFLTTHPMRAAPFAAAGAVVRAGDIVGLMRVGVLMAPVVAPADGVVAAVLAEDGDTVGFGAPLLALAATDEG